MTNAIQVVVEDLYIYPVKSCAPVRVASLAFDASGLIVGDREWVVVDENSNVVWQGTHPRLALVHPEFRDGHETLRNSDGDCVQVERSATPTAHDVHIWNDATKQNDTFSATDAGEEVAAFLKHTVGAPLRLMRLGRDGQHRAGSNRVHMVSRASFEELACDLPPAAQPLESLIRFRPNIVFGECSEPLLPFIEEHFTKLEWSMGTTTSSLVIAELCVRCVVPNVDPATGGEDVRVLEVVSRHSATRYPGHPIYFGLYATSKGPSTLTRDTVLNASLAF